MRKVRWSKSFEKRFAKMQKEIQKATYKKLDFLVEDPSHPSLRLEKLTKDIWAFSVTMKYRVTFQYSDGDIVLRKIGTHDILRRP